MLKLYALLSAHSHLHHCVHVTLTYCYAVKLFWYYCSRIAPIARIFFVTCFITTEMTDFTDFVSIACSLRY